MNCDSEEEDERPFFSTQRMSFVPLGSRSSYGRLHARMPLYPTQEHEAGYSPTERLERKREHEASETARKKEEALKSRLGKLDVSTVADKKVESVRKEHLPMDQRKQRVNEKTFIHGKPNFFLRGAEEIQGSIEPDQED